MIVINHHFHSSRVCWGLFTEDEYRTRIARPGEINGENMSSFITGFKSFVLSFIKAAEVLNKID